MVRATWEACPAPPAHGSRPGPAAHVAVSLGMTDAGPLPGPDPSSAPSPQGLAADRSGHGIVGITRGHLRTRGRRGRHAHGRGTAPCRARGWRRRSHHHLGARRRRWSAIGCRPCPAPDALEAAPGAPRLAGRSRGHLQHLWRTRQRGLARLASCDPHVARRRDQVGDRGRRGPARWRGSEDPPRATCCARAPMGPRGRGSGVDRARRIDGPEALAGPRSVVRALQRARSSGGGLGRRSRQQGTRCAIRAARSGQVVRCSSSRP